MAETRPQEPIDLGALGEHVGQALTAHRERHEQDRERLERDQVKAERKQKLSELRDRVHFLTDSEGLGERAMTSAYEVKTLDTGTNVAATVGTKVGIDTSKSVRSVAQNLVETERFNAGGLYLEVGPRSATEDAEDTFATDSARAEKLQEQGSLDVQLTLESPHEAGGESTQDSVFVGAILDPESILVPEGMRKEGSGEEHLYGRVIGPDDSRFGPIMDVLSHVNQGVGGSGGEVPHPGE